MWLRGWLTRTSTLSQVSVSFKGSVLSKSVCPTNRCIHRLAVEQLGLVERHGLSQVNILYRNLWMASSAYLSTSK